MKKIIFILFTFQLLSLTVYSQPVSQEWIRRYDGPDHIDDYLYDMVIDTSGNVYVTGGVLLNSNMNEEFCTVKYNAVGVQQWVSNFYESGFACAKAITVDKMGNVYTGGYSNGYACTIKYNSSGVMLWVSKYKYLSNGGDEILAIAVDDYGNVYAAGRSESNRPWPLPSPGNDYLIIKYNSNGDSLWVRRYKSSSIGSSDNNLYSMCIDIEGNSYVTGESPGVNSGRQLCTIKYNTNGVQQWIVRNDTMRNSGGYKITRDPAANDIYVCGYMGGGSFPQYFMVSKINASGIKQWDRYYTDSPSSTSYDVLVDNNHDIVAVGRASYSQTGDEYLTIKYNVLGDSIWVRRFNVTTISSSMTPVVTIDKYNSIYLTGNRLNNSDFEFATLKYDINGNQNWLMTYPGGGEKVAVDKNLNVYVAGANGCAGTGRDYLTIKYSQPDGIVPISNNFPKEISLFQNFPNPFNPLTKIKFGIPAGDVKNSEQVELKIYDILGREVAVIVNENLKPCTYEVVWDAGNYPSGVYFYKLSAGSFTETKKMVLMK